MLKTTLLCVAALAIVSSFACSSSKLGDRPTEFAGSWIAVRQGVSWRVTLRENGRFRAFPEDPQFGATREGEWGVVDGKIAWSYTDSESRIKTVLTGPDEVNEIRKISIDAFELTERDGSRSRFVREGSAETPARTAPPPPPQPSEEYPEIVEPSEPVE